jgi:hypothetical protein
MTRPRPSRLAAVGGGLGVLAVVAGFLGVGRAPGSAEATDGEPATTATATATVGRRDLVEREELDGTLGYGDRTELALAAQGRLTALAEAGSVVDRGGVIAEVDGRPIHLLFGARPLWRTLDAGAGDGPDVRQLEENLVALGHATATNLTVDEDWTDATTAAVKRWQKAIGREETGVVTPADVVVAGGPVRVAERLATIGSMGGAGPVLAVTATEQVVTVDLEASRRALLSVGDAVEAELPDGTTVDGTVRDVAAVVTPPADPSQGGDPTVEVTIALPGGVVGGFESSPVDVRITSAEAQGVLAVPVHALLALAEGGYAVERVRDGRTELVGVETGAFADGHVEVQGDLEAGDEVVVPR